jgi:predicted dehydrogenase
LTESIKGDRVGIAFLGCGYAADFYGPTLPNYPHLHLVGAHDPLTNRARSFTERYGGKVFTSASDLFSDPDVDIVVNLTPVDLHFSTSRAALAAGKHVYSEKPLATNMKEANELASFARQRGLLLSSAPATAFSQSAQTLIESVRTGMIGRPRLAYAALDMGPLAFMGYRDWRSPRDVPWPYRDEVRNGCVLEHAGYLLTWMVLMFGPVVRVSSHAVAVFKDEWLGIAPDVSIGCLWFADGTVCRITLGWVAPADRSLLLMGDQGALSVEDVWQASSPVILRRRATISGRDTGYLGEPEQVPFVVPPLRYRYEDAHDLTTGAGIADMAEALLTGRTPLLSNELSLHVLDVTSRLASGTGKLEETTEEVVTPAELHTQLKSMAVR